MLILLSFYIILIPGMYFSVLQEKIGGYKSADPSDQYLGELPGKREVVLNLVPSLLEHSVLGVGFLLQIVTSEALSLLPGRTDFFYKRTSPDLTDISGSFKLLPVRKGSLQMRVSYFFM
jgi:hypothetical protein